MKTLILMSILSLSGSALAEQVFNVSCESPDIPMQSQFNLSGTVNVTKTNSFFAPGFSIVYAYI